MKPVLARWCGNSKEDNESAIQAQCVFIREMADSVAEFGLWNSCNFVDHEARKTPQAVVFIWFNRQAEERSVGRVRRERADRDVVRSIEAVVLHNDRRARLSRIIFTTSDGPDFSAFHAAF